MSDDIILKASNISKQYRLGLVGTGTLTHDLNRFWHKIRGKEDPYLQIGAVNDRSAASSSDYVWALQDINFEIKRGEILGIIGKNGAGKSTLLKILSRVTSPTTGSIKTKGRIASLLEVGTGMHPELTGRENVYLNGAILGMNKTEISSKIDEIIEFSGCQMYIDTPVKRYSSGMRVRLGFAVAAFLEPDILVVDEVLAVGDVEFQKKAIGKMQDISTSGGRTVLFVSHNMASVQKLCDRIIVIKNGLISLDTKNVDEGINNYVQSNEDEAIQLIKNRKDRKGRGDVVLEHVRILNASSSSELESVIAGKDIYIELNFKNKSGIMGPIDISIPIRRSNGEVLIYLRNTITEDNIIINDNESLTLRCYLPKFPLTEGRYYCNVTLLINDIMQDWLMNAFSIDVINGDFYGTGKINPSSHGGVLVSHKWE